MSRELLKGMLLNKRDIKKLPKDILDLTKFKDKLIKEKSQKYKSIFNLNDEIGYMNTKLERMECFR